LESFLMVIIGSRECINAVFIEIEIRMKRTQLIVLCTLHLLFISSAFAQNAATNNNTNQTITFRTTFTQIKDEFNYGLVFSGINLGVNYSYLKETGNYTFRYTPELDLGVNFNKGIGTAWRLKPVDVFYGYNIGKSKPFTLGAYFATDYNWNFYPYLQSGHMFWHSSIEIGPQVRFALPFQSKKIIISYSNSLAGFNSRPKLETETYYYAQKLTDYISNVHRNMEFGSFNLFNHSNLEIELPNCLKDRLSVAYEFEYCGYYKSPTLTYIGHSLNLTWKIDK